MSWYEWKPYVPVAVKRARSLGNMEKLRKKGLRIQPVAIGGREITRTFWGRAWCDHLEKFSDFANRLPRGRAYVRNGLVCHLEIAESAVKAMVSGSELYNVDITIKKLPGKKWADLRRQCAGQIGSLLELLQGRLSKSVMSVVTDRDKGLFPLPSEISLKCDCPDWAVMCKHVAAVLYGVGARLDERPDLLFLLRGVDHEDLIGAEVGFAVSSGKAEGDGRRRIAEAELSGLFGIEISDTPKKGFDRAAGEVGSSIQRKKPPSHFPAPHETLAAQKASKDRRTPNRVHALPLIRKAKEGSRAVSGSGAVTGATVVKLRLKFNMSQGQFARLIGVCTPTVCSWEEREGGLNLQARTRETLNLVLKLKKQEAWGRLRKKLVQATK